MVEKAADVGVKKDIDESRKYRKMAADNGHPLAMNEYSNMNDDNEETLKMTTDNSNVNDESDKTDTMDAAFCRNESQSIETDENNTNNAEEIQNDDDLYNANIPGSSSDSSDW